MRENYRCESYSEAVGTDDGKRLNGLERERRTARISVGNFGFKINRKITTAVVTRVRMCDGETESAYVASSVASEFTNTENNGFNLRKKTRRAVFTRFPQSSSRLLFLRGRRTKYRLRINDIYLFHLFCDIGTSAAG